VRKSSLSTSFLLLFSFLFPLMFAPSPAHLSLTRSPRHFSVLLAFFLTARCSAQVGPLPRVFLVISCATTRRYSPSLVALINVLVGTRRERKNENRPCRLSISVASYCVADDSLAYRISALMRNTRRARYVET